MTSFWSYTAPNTSSTMRNYSTGFLMHDILLLLLQSSPQPLWVMACSTIVEYSQQEGFYRVPLPAARQPPQIGGPVIRTFQLLPPGVPHVWNDASEPQQRKVELWARKGREFCRKWMHDIKPQNTQTCSLRIYMTLHSIFLHVSVGKWLSSGNQTKVIQHNSKSVTFVHMWCGIIESDG